LRGTQREKIHIQAHTRQGGKTASKEKTAYGSAPRIFLKATDQKQIANGKAKGVRLIEKEREQRVPA
jgi:hypothetical protein